MTRIKLGHALAAIVAAVAVLNTLSALSMPVRDRRQELWVVLTWLALLALHAAVYRFGDRIRDRFGVGGYAVAQGVLLFGIAVSGVPAPVTLGVFMACTAELVLLAGAQWGSIRITLGAIALFVLAALITQDLYRATTAGLLLAVTGLIAHALAALIRRPSPVTTAEPARPTAPPTATNGAGNLSAREVEVLRELVSGARNNDIARTLGISERTVKSHLGSIYQKLGVETRAAAVAAAVQRGLV